MEKQRIQNSSVIRRRAQFAVSKRRMVRISSKRRTGKNYLLCLQILVAKSMQPELLRRTRQKVNNVKLLQTKFSTPTQRLAAEDQVSLFRSNKGANSKEFSTKTELPQKRVALF